MTHITLSSGEVFQGAVVPQVVEQIGRAILEGWQR